MFYKKGVLRNFAKFTGKHLCQSPSFNKVSGSRPANLLKRRLWQRCFPVNFTKFLGTPSFKEHFWWLLLSINIVFFGSEDRKLCEKELDRKEDISLRWKKIEDAYDVCGTCYDKLGCKPI